MSGSKIQNQLFENSMNEEDEFELDSDDESIGGIGVVPVANFESKFIASKQNGQKLQNVNVEIENLKKKGKR